MASYNKLTVEDINPKGKRVFVRVDFNVPLDENQKITDDTRIRESLKTIQYLADKGAKVVLCSHLGRPKGVDEKLRLKPVAERLAELLKKPVLSLKDSVGPVVEKSVAAMKEGDVALLENVRFYPEEEKNNPDFAKKLAALADIYVNDAFGTAHRAQASTHGVARYAPVACAGLLLQQEVTALSKAFNNPAKPMLAIVGGSKVSSKLSVLHTLSTMVNTLIVGGGIANTFLVAAGHQVVKSLYEPELVSQAKDIIDYCAKHGVNLPLPIDVVVATQFSDSAIAVLKNISQVNDDEMILDVGPQTTALYESFIAAAKTIVWNGPVGVFEIPQFSAGTKQLAEMVAKSEAFSIAGGGDTIAAIEQFKVTDKISYISTGGGAFLEFLEGKPLPGIAILEQRYDALPTNKH